MIAHASDRYAPGDALGIVTTSRADLPQTQLGAGAYLIPVLVLVALLVAVDRFGR